MVVTRVAHRTQVVVGITRLQVHGSGIMGTNTGWLNAAIGRTCVVIVAYHCGAETRSTYTGIIDGAPKAICAVGTVRLVDGVTQANGRVAIDVLTLRPVEDIAVGIVEA